MATKRKNPARAGSGSAKGPSNVVAVGVPRMPAVYGIKSRAKYTPWGRAEARLVRSRSYWICSTRADGRPHSAPVWGIWTDGAFYFSTGTETVKARNLTRNPSVSVHLESGDDAVILEGDVTVVSLEHTMLLKKLDAAYKRKYKMGLMLQDSVLYRLQPRVALAWTEKGFVKDATRWQFKQM